jgi:hypothetical protein
MNPSQRPANKTQGANERLSDDQITKEKPSQIPEEELADLGPRVDWLRLIRVAEFRGASGALAPAHLLSDLFPVGAREWSAALVLA